MKHAPWMTGLGDTLDYASADTSFSPFYSDIGLGIEKQGGIACLFLHYNRKTTRFLTPFLAMPDTLLAQTCTPLCVSQRYAGGTATIAFCAHNTWIVDCNGFEELSFSLAHATEFTEVRYKKVSATIHVFDGYMPTIDPRDPDRQFPLVLGIRIVRGRLRRGNGREQPLQMAADKKGRLVVAFSVRMLAVAHAPLVQRLMTASRTAADASARTHAWLRNAVGTARIAADNPAEQAVLARALHALLSNSTEAPGLLAGRIAAFPSRGRYPTHFLWDSCFQNLAAAYLHPQLAEDSLLLLTDNLRADGKMPHFICSTWLRPHESQPPLVGWAGLRLVQERNDMSLAARLLPALQRNTQWWLSQRMTRFGLIAAQHGLETGWDNSPRFDQGPTVACDLNSYLLLQMRACAEFSRMLGDKDGAKAQTAEADAYAHRMVAVLYDKGAGLFWDIHLASGEPVTIKTPACLLPLLADVPLP
ncbi:MAG: trehalase family glycosidase, partial [bacterium]|nr:trehalase family glycosidase [bacterium]